MRYVHYTQKRADPIHAKTYQENHFARRRLIFTDEQVVFECNTCRRNESMLFAMSEEEDQCSDIFGMGPGRPRSTLSLHQHIEIYSQCILTYQSDILNALRGLFASFLRYSPPIRQFWGIPTINTAFFSMLEPDPDNPVPKSPSLGRVFAFGLAWAVTIGSTPIRRTGFPSWSWAGWTTSVAWLTGMPSKLDKSGSPKFCLINRHGTISPLTDELIDQVFAGSNDVSPYTYLLHVKAEILQVTFVDLFTVGTEIATFLKEKSRHPSWDDKRNRYAAMDDSSHLLFDMYWFIQLTHDIEKCDELYTALCTEVFKCIVLSSDHGIVVRDRGGVTERIGLLQLLASGCIGEDWLHSIPRPRGAHIRDFFPGSVGEIVLG